MCGITKDTAERKTNFKKQFLRVTSCPLWFLLLSFRSLLRLLVFLFHPHDRNLSESLLKRRRLQLGSHAPHDILGNDPVAPLMPFNTDLQRHIEEDSMHLVVVILGQ